jgi:hypothetical protein
MIKASRPLVGRVSGSSPEGRATLRKRFHENEAFFYVHYLAQMIKASRLVVGKGGQHLEKGFIKMKPFFMGLI